MNLVVAARKVDSMWKSAVVLDSNFVDAFIGKDLGDIVANVIMPVIVAASADSEVTVTVNIVPRKQEG